MAKQKKRKAPKANRRRTKVVDQRFLGDLHSVTRAINAAARLVEQGRKKAVAAIEKGTNAPMGSPAHRSLAFNKEALKQADQLLMAFRSARGTMVAQCCNNDENCNFVVRVTRAS